MSVSLYDVLGVSTTATPAELRAAYRKRARDCHPDKQYSSSSSIQERTQEQPSSFENSDVFREEQEEGEFIALQRAYETLADSDTRRVYDEELARGAAAAVLPLWREVDLDDMEVRQAHDENQSWFLTCRCGGRYCVNEEMLDSGMEYVQCDSCTLVIKVLYDALSESGHD